MKTLFKLAVAILLTMPSLAQSHAGKSRSISVADELDRFSRIADLPKYITEALEKQVSSYDPTGGNDDGFAGTYSYMRRNPDGSLVIFDVQGPGVINRIWTPTPTDDTLDFFIDDSVRPALSIRFSDLFSDKVSPFLTPLTGRDLGGCYCYFPILFQSGCKIVDRGKTMQFFQIQYRSFPTTTIVKAFSGDLNGQEAAAFGRVRSVWDAGIGILGSQEFASAVSLRPGETKNVFSMNGGGRILGLEFDPSQAFAGENKDVDIRITWDGEKIPAVYCPLSDFFGYAFGKPSMESLLLGARGDKNYCYFPMPFDNNAKVELIYRKRGITQPVMACHVKVIYNNKKRDPETEGKFYSQWNTNKLTENDPFHIFLQTSGKGHYVGSILQAQGLIPGMTSFFEGDDSTAVDGVSVMHGTGSEDYFNGGWYACPDRWDRRKSLPLHGALEYSLPLCRTGGYRLYLADKIPFTRTFWQGMEHGLSKYGMPADYTSLGLYYCDRGPDRQLKPNDSLSIVYIPDTLMIYPQLMEYTVWGSVAMNSVSTPFHTGGPSYNYSVTGDTRIRIALNDIPAGRYKIFGDIVKRPDGCKIQVLQGQQEAGNWVDSHADSDERAPFQPLGEISLDARNTSITFIFKPSGLASNFFLNRLVLVRSGN